MESVFSTVLRLYVKEMLICLVLVAVCASNLGLCSYVSEVPELANRYETERVETEETDSCPAQNPKHPVLLPDPIDCRKFYICDNGIPYLQTCQPGLHFNKKIKACDFPDTAGCETGETVSEKPRGKMIDDEDSGICPNKNSEYPVLIPHPTDCSMFFICDSGTPHPQTCQNGLHFNPKVKACDFPNRAGCDGYTEVPDVSEDSGGCPYKNSDHPTYLPHPIDCSKFYICDSGVPYMQTCQPGLHFNRNVKACDFPENAGCDKSIPSLMAGVGVRSEFCPPVNGKTPIFFRSSSNCSVYYMCSHGLAYEFVCPARLHFNLRKKGCDFENEARCDIS